MGSELVSGISTTNGLPTNPLMTFIWDLIESPDQLEVTCKFGIAGTTTNFATACITVGCTTGVRISGQGTDGSEIGGTLTAAWANSNKSYVVTFSGFMLVGNVNNVFSSDQNGTPGDSAPIIVGAYLAE